MKKVNIEKLMWALPVLLYAFMQLSAFGIFKNIYQANVAAAPAGWHVMGFVVSVFAGVWAWGTIRDKNFVSKDQITNVLIIVGACAFSLLAYAGFVFNG